MDMWPHNEYWSAAMHIENGMCARELVDYKGFNQVFIHQSNRKLAHTRFPLHHLHRPLLSPASPCAIACVYCFSSSNADDHFAKRYSLSRGTHTKAIRSTFEHFYLHLFLLHRTWLQQDTKQCWLNEFEWTKRNELNASHKVHPHKVPDSGANRTTSL